MVKFKQMAARALPFLFVERETPVISVDKLDPFAQSRYIGGGVFDGDKFPGGFGSTQLFQMDYWTLRQRSAQLFTENLYARGLIRRLVTNEINTGITPEACPEEAIIGVPEDSLAEWTETVESRFNVWSKGPRLCDWKQESTFGAIQREARREALISGDVLIVVRQSKRTGSPMIQLVSGDKVRTPLGDLRDLRAGHTVVHGVELSAKKQIVAYWVHQADLSFKRVPARGARSGRKVAWLVFGTDKRLDDLRGQPLLSIVLQSLKEIDRYRDSVQRKAVINSILAMFIKKTADKPGTLPVTGGALRKDVVDVVDSDGKTREFGIAKQLPGMVMEELQVGEEPVGFGSKGTDSDFAAFEGAILRAVAWAHELPPEILILSFTNNYSASQAAINEFKIYLNMVWSYWGESFCTPIYIEWMLSEILSGRILAPGLLDAWRNPMKWDIFGAWVLVDWYGSIKPSTDMLKQAKGSKLLVDQAWSTNAREARMNTGTKFAHNVKRIKRENEQLVEAKKPLQELEPGAEIESPTARIEEMEETLDNFLESANGK